MGMFNVTGPSLDGMQLSLLGPKAIKESDDIKLMIESGTGEWIANEFTTTGKNPKYSTKIASDIKRYNSKHIYYICINIIYLDCFKFRFHLNLSVSFVLVQLLW